jgi:hypothetical protein
MRKLEPISADKSIRSELLRIGEAILHAICSHDAKVLSSYLADDFVLLSGASRQDRTSFLEGVGAADFKALHADFEAIEVELWGTTAVVAGVQRIELEHGLESLVSRAAFTDLFVYEMGHWLLRVAVSVELEES